MWRKDVRHAEDLNPRSLKWRLYMQACDCPGSGRAQDFAEMKRQLDEAEADIALVNQRLDDAQGIDFSWRLLVRGDLGQPLTMCILDADGAAVVEGLRAEHTKAKGQARRSDAAAEKAREELKAEQASHC